MNQDEDVKGYYRRMQSAVEELLILKGLFSRAELEKEITSFNSRSYVRGALMVARAWLDPEYKDRMLADGGGAANEIGIGVGKLPLIVVENTASVHNVIVCTLCSCYPRSLLGMPPHWYVSTEYRSRVVREPRAVLAEFGTSLPDPIDIRVHDSTADMRYMVLPLRPPSSEGLSEEELAALVTCDSLMGVSQPRAPGGAPR
jgi:nitrile hydratase